jgi:hypothetical protein
MPFTNTLTGAAENQKGISILLKWLERKLPCSEKHAVAYLHFRSGHSTRFIREEIIEPLKDMGILEFDGEILRLANGNKKIDLEFGNGELPTDENGNHIPEEEEDEENEETESQA